MTEPVTVANAFGNALGNGIADKLGETDWAALRNADEPAGKQIHLPATPLPVITAADLGPVHIADTAALSDLSFLKSNGDGQGTYTDSAFADGGPYVLRRQFNNGKWVNPPSQHEVDWAIKTFPAFDLVKNMRYTRAEDMGKLSVVRDGRSVVLTGNFSVYSSQGPGAAEQLISDINSRFKDISVTSEGLTYKTDFSFHVQNHLEGADLKAYYYALPDHRELAHPNGEVLFDTGVDVPFLTKGVGAHEFAHAILGLPDAYHGKRSAAPPC